MATAFAAEPDPEVHVLPPWTIEETTGPQSAARQADFASALGPSSVLSAADWSGHGIATLTEALRRTPGVMLQESFGGFEPPRLSVRGSGLDSAPTSRGVALLIDGLPLARADGAFHSGLFDPLLFPRVEIHRGTLPLALSPAVLGGAINATALAADAPAGRQVQTQGGDFGLSRIQFTGTMTGTMPVHAAASFQQSEGWREHSAQQRTAFQLATHRALTAATQLEVSVYAATAAYDVPGPLTLSAARAQPRSVFAAVIRDHPRRDSAVVRVAAQLKSHPADGEQAFGVAWQRLADDFYQLQPNGETDLEARTFSSHATFSRRLHLGGIDHRFLARLTYTTGEDEVDRYLNVLSQRGARFGAYETRADTVAVSVEDVVWLGPTLSIGAGFTALHGRREVNGPPLRSARAFDDLSPRAVLRWSPRDRISFHAGVSRGIEPPTFDDLVPVQGKFPDLTLGTRDLRAQSAVTFEIGGWGTAGPFDWDVTAYHAAWRHEILRLADANGLPRGAVNADRTIHQGLETALRWRLWDGASQLTLSLTSTLGRFTFDDDPVYGRYRIAGAPPHTGQAELRYESPQHVFAAVGTTWTAGRIPVDHGNRMFYDGDMLAHLRVGWHPVPRLLLHVIVRNVFDETSVASTAGVLDLARNPAATVLFLPGSGRSFAFGLELKL